MLTSTNKSYNILVFLYQSKVYQWQVKSDI
jgi:hypothetical protein